MLFILLLFQLPIELTPEQIEAVRRLLNNAREAASDQTPKSSPPPKFAPLSNDGGKSGVAPIGDKSFTAGRSDSAGGEGITRSPPMRNQKRCLCGPECPYCSGDCSTCDCIYEPLPPPGPGRIRWQRLRASKGVLRSRF